jgi:hypothetical protein
LQAVTVSENVLTDLVQATFEYYESVRSQDDYETACGRERLEVERRHGTIIAERLKEFDASRVADRKRTVWSWYPLYHICATNRHLEERLPPLPWSHFVDEAINVHKALSYVLHPLTPSRRPLYSTADPIDEATALNISKWASLGTGSDASVRLVLEMGSSLFGDYVNVGGASLKELNAACNRLVVGDLDEL